MKIEVKTKEGDFIELEGVETIFNLEEGYSFLDEKEQPLLFVQHSNLSYYRKV